MNESASKSTRWGVMVAIAVILLLAYPLRFILLPFVAAGALAYVARPLVHWLQRQFQFPHWLAALVPFVLFLCILAASAYGVDRMLIPQLSEMLSHAPELLRQFLTNVFHGNELHFAGKTITVNELVNDVMNSPQVSRVVGPSQLINVAATGFAVLMGFVITIVVLAFFLFEGPRLLRGLLWLVPPHLRPRVRSLTVQVDPMLANYLRGVFLIVLYASGATCIVTGLIFHVAHAILLGVAVGLLELIPVIGPILSFVAFGLVAVQQTGIGAIIGFGIFAIALRLSIDQLVGPLVLGRAARIPAVVVIFAFLAGGVLYGILGVVLAIPAAATVKIVLANLYETPSVPRSVPVGRRTGGADD